MLCPKCEFPCENVVFETIEIDRCTYCKGIWFDTMEDEDLIKLDGSESIDTGDKKTGELFNKLRRVNCPRCHVKMLSMTDKTQFHIQYESCPVCFGVFYDAGEFKDLKELTVSERLQKLLITIKNNLRDHRADSN